jgi:hypothetical protein
MMTEKMDYVENAMRDAGISNRDARGLMPLAEARACVQKATEFRRGSGRMIGETWVFDSDILWAALLSLEDVEAFNREAKRLNWFFHPRDPLSTALHQRYGDGITEWLASHLRPNGVLLNVPWCLLNHIVAVGTLEAFHIVNNTRDVDFRQDPEAWPGPFATDSPGDYDKYDLLPSPEPDGDQYFQEGNKLLQAWLDRHEALGFPLLAESADQGNRRAVFFLKTMASDGIYPVFQLVSDAREEEWTAALFDRLEAPRP